MPKQRFTIEEKQQVIKYHLEHKKQHPEWTLRQTASAFNLNHQTIKNWVDTYQEIGLERLIDHRTKEYQKSAAVGENAQIIAFQKQIRVLKRALKRAEIRENTLKKSIAYWSQKD